MLKKLSAAATTTAFVLSASTALAQSLPFAEVDTDADGMLSNEELVAAFGEGGAEILMADDSDGDGMLSVAEIRIAADASTGMSDDMDDVDSPDERSASEAEEEPDYRDADGTNDGVDPNTIDENGTGNEEDEEASE